MSERKVLNKYYPPEFDPSKIPKLRVKKTGIFSIRIMAPFNMRCNTCGEYIYKGKKFNSRKENVDDEDYLGLRIFRFYIRCPRCIAEIAFKTDLANTDYALEAGATRLFEAERLAHEMAEKERKEKEEDELNPMKLLENRTKASRNEIEQIDQLEELKEMNSRHARVDHQALLEKHMAYEEQLLKLQEEEEDNLVKSILGKGKSGPVIKRIHDDDGDAEDKKSLSESASAPKVLKTTDSESTKASDILVDKSTGQSEKKAVATPSWQRSVGSFSKKTSLAGLVRKKTSSSSSAISSSTVPSPAATASSSSTQSSSSSSTYVIPSGRLSKCSNSNGTYGVRNSTAATSKNPVQSCSVSSSDEKVKINSNGEAKPFVGIGTGLAFLGNYSDSDDSNSSE